MANWNLEHTDTFGGDANYCWVNRETVRASTHLGVVRKAKAFAGFTGLRCEVSDFGDSIEIRPIGRNAPCEVVFATFVD